jgi:UDP-GlcNAc3NAcA epimerase
MIVSIIGARPQFVKAAVVSRALRDIGIKETIVHSGQHYDDNMSGKFWQELNIPSYSINLKVGSGSQGRQTAKIIERLESYILSLVIQPKYFLLYGDTNSTLAGSIVASKLNIPIIHIEAGLRSFNRRMPEEINRIVTDHLSSYLFCSSENSVLQLAKEGITENVYNVGDVMFDAVIQFSKHALTINHVLPFTDKEFNLLTLHRPSNTDNEENLSQILIGLKKTKSKILWPVHPRMKKNIANLDIPSNIYVVEPLSYFEMLNVISACNKVFTDSGGLQKEAYWLKKPCITLRDETEWKETLNYKWNIVTGANKDKIYDAYNFVVDMESWVPLYGDGHASKRIATIIKNTL